MSTVFQKSGVSVVENIAGRSLQVGGADGRLDLLTCEYKIVQGSWSGRFNAVDAYANAYFKPYTPHPSLQGFYVLPDSVDVVTAHSGIATARVSYIGSNSWPNIPDAFVEGMDSEQIEVKKIGLVSEIINYEVLQVRGVHYGETAQSFAAILNSVVNVLDSSAGGNASLTRSTVCLSKVENLMRHGPWLVQRYSFVPPLPAALTIQYNTYGTTVTLSSIGDASAILASDNLTKIVLGNITPANVSMNGLTYRDTFLSRLGGAGSAANGKKK